MSKYSRFWFFYARRGIRNIKDLRDQRFLHKINQY